MSSLIRRPRQSPWPAVPMDDALRLIHENWGEVNVIEVELDDLKAGDIIAKDVHSPWPHPRFRTSRMDGYAFKSEDGMGEFNVLGGIGAGTSAVNLKMLPKNCYRINTGGVVPDQTNTVVPVEFTKLIKHDDQNELVIEIQKHMSIGQNIREVGSDIKDGELLIPVGAELGAAEIGLLASCGINKLRVFEKPKVGVMSTGDELIEPSICTENLLEGQIYDSNRRMLMEVFKGKGFEAKDRGIVIDRQELLVEAIIDGFQECDVLVLSGGVSMGDKDLLKSVLQEDLKFTIHFGRVFMKPGLPSTFATGSTKNRKFCMLFGLPGNPVSAFVSAHLFVLPLLRRKSGQSVEKSEGTVIKVRINTNYKLDNRPEYARACFKSTDDGLPIGEIISSNQVSSRLISVSHANLLLKLPPKSDQKTEIKRGEILGAIIIEKI